MDTQFGPVEIHGFEWAGEPPYAVLRHLVSNSDLTRLRIQAQCLTSTAFAARTCDCGDQIETGVRLAATEPGAIMIYLPQEGRGHGLLSKIEIMARVNEGLSPPQAQQAVGRSHSGLSYHRVPAILRHLRVSGPVALLTDNREKAEAVAAVGVIFATIEPVGG